MDKEITLKLFLNKKNNQISLVLPKKKLDFPKDKIPKKIRLKIKGIEWFD